MDEKKYTHEDVFNALNSMDEKKRTFLLEKITISSLLDRLNSDENFEEAINEIDDYIAHWQLLEADLIELKTRLVTGEYNVASEIDKDTVSEKYDDLKEDDKKYVVLNLMNNSDFQKKCCEILCSDIKRCINNDATLKALDQLFGMSEYVNRLISAGIGCDHVYRIE